MAKARSLLLSSISGNVGGTEFAMSKNGMLIKARKPTKKMNSPREIAARRVFEDWAKKWAELDPSYKQAFNAFAANNPQVDSVGNTKYLSGRNWFLKLRVPLSNDYTPFAEFMPPLYTTSYYFTHYAYIWAGGPYTIGTYNNEPYNPNMVESVWIARFQSPTTSHQPKTWISIGTFPRFTVTTAYFDRFTAAGVELCPGEHIAIKFVARCPYKWPCAPYIFWTTVEPYIAAWWKMNDDSANIVVADAKNVNSAIIIDPGGDPNTDAHTVAGHDGTALYCDGVDDYIQLPDAIIHPTLTAGTDFTLALWYKPDSPDPAAAKDFVSNYTPTAYGILLNMFDSHFYMSTLTRDGGGTHLYSVESPAHHTNAWWHLAVVRQGTTITFYIAGASIGSDTHAMNSLSLADPAKHMTIGARQVPSKWAPGAVDDFRLYAHALRPDEIAALAVM